VCPDITNKSAWVVLGTTQTHQICDEAFKTDAGKMEVHDLALQICASSSPGAELLCRTLVMNTFHISITGFDIIVVCYLKGVQPERPD